MNTALFDTAAARRFAARKQHNPGAYVAVTMNFFPDKVLQVRWTSAVRNDQDSIVWTGSVEGVHPGQATLIAGKSGVVANVNVNDGRIYQIRTVGAGAVWVREVDQKRFPAEGNLDLVRPVALRTVLPAATRPGIARRQMSSNAEFRRL